MVDTETMVKLLHGVLLFVRLWDHGVNFYVAISLVAGFDSDSDWQWFLFSSSSLSHDSSSNATD